jgi:very-short-patch-repair endonuclease
MDPRLALSRSSGVTRSSTLQKLGVSRYRIAREVEAGRLLRPRQGWIALPDADPELLAAARDGVVLSCITQARRLGLWVLREDRLHVAAPRPTSHARAPGCAIHWGAPLVPRDPDVLEDPLDNVLAYVAACQPWESALAIWESAINRGTTTLERLRRLPFRGAAKDLLAHSTPFSDSGLESIFLTRLRWLRMRIVPQAWVHGHRVDFLIGERLVIQIDGATDTGAQRDTDNRHDAVLQLHGYHVIRVGYRQVMAEWPTVQLLIMTAIAQGLHLAR